MTLKVLPHKEYLEAIQEQEAVLVAGSVSYFSDDLPRRCIDCGAALWIRPYNKEATKIVCLSCFLKVLKEQECRSN